MKLSVIGLGKLGAPMLAVLASKGHRVIGCDMDEEKVALVNQRLAPVREPGLGSLIRQQYITATTSIELAVRNSAATFVVVATPTDPETNEFSLKYMLPALEAIGAALAKKSTYHLVVITSTVMPGMTNGIIRQTLEDTSGKKCGPDFGLCYNPEFIALGTVICDFQNPDIVLIGECDKQAGDMLEALGRTFCMNDPYIARLTPVNAELAKLSVNTFITAKISYANMLATICERIPGANVDEVTRTIGHDSRIGGKYLTGAVGYGGPCFPRDNRALAAMAKRIGATATLAEAVDSFNRSYAQRVAAMIPQDSRVAVLGLSYKIGSEVTEQAFGRLLAETLNDRGTAVHVSDPIACHANIVSLTFYEALAWANVFVLALPHEEYLKLPRDLWERSCRCRMRMTVIDCWRRFGHLKGIDGLYYLPIGVGPDES